MKLLISLVLGFTLLGVAPASADEVADYYATGSGSATAEPGGTFTKTLTIGNQGGTVNAKTVSGIIQGIPNVVVLGAESSGFTACRAYGFGSPQRQIPFGSNASVNYVRCFGANLAPGDTATMTVTYVANPWVNWTYYGGGRVGTNGPTAYAPDSTTTNNYVQLGATVVGLG
jgi:hypothetical protein